MSRACTEGLAAIAIPFRRDVGQQIHTNEITQAALTTRSVAARMRSPPGPAAVHTGFQVIVPHTAKVNKVEIMILLTRPSVDSSTLAVRVKKPNRLLGSATQAFSHRPIILPILASCVS